MMRKVKNRFYLDYEKEEQWINDMSQEGWHLEKLKFFRYTFVKGERGSYIYRNEFLSGLTLKEKDDYLEFLKESGIEVVSEFGGWAYLRRKSTEGPFELYSDISSKVSYYDRILRIFIIIALLNFVIGIVNFIISGVVSNYGVINFTAAFFNFAIIILVLVPTLKIYRRKKTLSEKHQLFEE